MLELRKVRKSFGATQALIDVSLSAAPGEVHAILGENGAGKSTLMKTLSGAVVPDGGEMLLQGMRYAPLGTLDARNQGVMMIYQELSPAPHLSVAENISLGVEPSHALGWLDRKKIFENAKAALGELGHADILPNQIIRDLPLAKQQLVEIARAISSQCKVLILDEPTSSLNREDVQALFALIQKLKAQGKIILYISHFLDEVKQIADRYTILRDGKTVVSGEVSSSTPEAWVAAMLGLKEVGSLKELYHRGTAKGVSGEVALSFKNFTLKKGEILGIAGLMGSGRTELLRELFKSGGSLGLLSENRKEEGLALRLSIAENMTLSKLEKCTDKWGFVSPTRQNAVARNWIEKLKIKCAGPTQWVEFLSGGNQQKVAIARLLHQDVDIWLLDEPTRGIDVGSKAQIYALLDELTQRGKSIILVSSAFSELMGLCDRIGVMVGGVLGEFKSASEWSEEKLLIEASGKGDVAS